MKCALCQPQVRGHPLRALRREPPAHPEPPIPRRGGWKAGSRAAGVLRSCGVLRAVLGQPGAVRIKERKGKNGSNTARRWGSEPGLNVWRAGETTERGDV